MDLPPDVSIFVYGKILGSGSESDNSMINRIGEKIDNLLKKKGRGYRILTAGNLEIIELFLTNRYDHGLDSTRL